MVISPLIKGSTIVATGVSTILGGWLFLDSYFARAADVAHEKLNTQQMMMIIRLESINDSLDRAKKAGDTEKVEQLDERKKDWKKRLEILDRMIYEGN